MATARCNVCFQHAAMPNCKGRCEDCGGHTNMPDIQRRVEAAVAREIAIAARELGG